MNAPRLRMIAGPNGSGKSTLLAFLRDRTTIPLGQCQNPDDVEEAIQRTGRLDFNRFDCPLELETLRRFLRTHPLGQREWENCVSATGNVLGVTPEAGGGYFAAVLCDFIRQQWLAARQTFTFETVMSSTEKIALLKDARAAGYRNYLYFICTDSATISVARVAARVAVGGHGVPRQKVEQRYERSLKLLPPALALANRAYLFDNSGAAHRVVAEYDNGTLVRMSKDLPPWFVHYVLHAASR